MSRILPTAIAGIVLLGGWGVYLLLPRGSPRGRAGGTACCLAALGALWTLWGFGFRPEVPLPPVIAFYVLGTFTVVAAVMVITQRSPVASGLWFTCVVVGTAGLFLLLSAQFLAAATVIVYAGAIIVMFLFVIMLARQHGDQEHNRCSREPALAVAGSFLLLAMLVSGILPAYGGPRPVLQPQPGAAPGITPFEYWDSTPAAPHVALLGRTLFTEHWLSIEIAGTLLLVAMVGAIVIAARRTGPDATARGRCRLPEPAPGED